MKLGEWIWRNGEWVKWADATVHVSAHALHYGSSVFEGIRAYQTEKGTAILRLRPHTQRLVNSCKIARIGLALTADELDAAILETVRRNAHPACYIRPLVFRGTGPAFGLNARNNTIETIVMTWEWGAYLGEEGLKNGIDAQISSYRRMIPMPMGKIGGQYINSSIISMEASDNGFTEGIALDINGHVSEGAGENIFVVHNGVLYTPGAGSSILLGVTRDSVIQLAHDMGVEVRYETIAREMLYVADEVFMTGTAAEITPIRSVDRVTVGAGKPGPITRQLQDAFFAVTSGKAEDKHGWLTYV
ncbi:MAG: branched-chain amino acid transaminase [Anaerolineae bacterium]|jgi:branched-chain amino acid aminotransferase|nr:branched-chain amino acid transaminase [Anaerolineae bacterium]